MSRIKIYIVFMLIWKVFVLINAQNPSIDSLYQLTLNNISDSLKIEAYLEMGQQYSDIGNLDSALIFLNKGYEVCKKTGNNYLLVKVYRETGIIYEYRGKYDNAAEYYFKSLRLAESINNKQLEAIVLINLGILNFNLKKADKAIEYYTNALGLTIEIHDTINQIRALNNIGNVYMTILLDFKRAENYFIKTVALGKKVGFEKAVIVGLNNLTEIYANTKQYNKAIQTCNEILKSSPNNSYTLYNLGSVWYLKKEYKNALLYMFESLKYMRNEPEFKQVVLKDVSDVYREIGEFENALNFYTQYSTLKDSVHKIQSEKNIMDIEGKYQNEKKQREILKLTTDKTRRNILIYSLIAILLFISIAAFYIYRNIRNKRIIAEKNSELHQQKIIELEKERQLLATQSVVKGEEAERVRLSRDLHDGLGGLLSGIKLSLSRMKGNFVISQENVESFDYTLGLLDTSIKELRRISHNMMPEAIVKLGLKDAIRDFADYAGKDKKISVRYSFYGENKRFEQTFETNIYRIAMELVNNALKYAIASEILIQLIVEENRVFLSVQDNGKGFDINKIDITKSSGLQNIRARIALYNGKLDIDSKIGQGTEIGVEFVN